MDPTRIRYKAKALRTPNPGLAGNLQQGEWWRHKTVDRWQHTIWLTYNKKEGY
jgi:hypothetical protein